MTAPAITVEGFLTDQAFVDHSNVINGILTDQAGKAASLSSKALSYFVKPGAVTDKRNVANRQTNWVATTSPQLIVDESIFQTFTDALNNSPSQAQTGLFKLLDKFLFNYSSTTSHASLEAALVADADIASIYTPGSFSLSSTILTETVFLQNNTQTVSLPAFVSFGVSLTQGQTVLNFALKIFTSIDSFITNYNFSSIVVTIPPLPYDQLYNASLINSTDNVFSTADITATLSFTTTQALLGNTSVSGIAEYKAILTDGTNSTIVPFNLLYKGRAPTQFEIRNAIKAKLLGCGIGSQAGWKARIPSVFVTGRFYIVPLWDQFYAKPDQILFPTIGKYTNYQQVTNTILSSLGYGDFHSYLDVFSVYYNKLTATCIPDLSGNVDVHHLVDIIPDYQDYSPTDEQFAYMLPDTQSFAKLLNQMLAIDVGAQQSLVYSPNTEGSLSFYSFTVNSYEICVITKDCYTNLMGGVQ